MQANLLLSCSSGAVKEGLFVLSTKASGSSIGTWSKAEHCKSTAVVEINVEFGRANPDPGSSVVERRCCCQE